VITSTTRFAGAVSGAGNGLWITNYGHDRYRYWYETELGRPWEGREIWEKSSPFNKVDKITTPTLYVLIGILAMAGIPYDRWLRFILPLMVKIAIVGSLALAVAVLIGYQ
jgi:hypothetical protein